MKELMQNLLRLQALDFKQSNEKNPEAVREELRGRIPAQILAHYDRLVVRGKKGVAIVRNQVCTGCHMCLPIGVITTLMHMEDIQLCDSCGRYLYLEQAAPVVEPVVAAPVKAKAAPKRRKRKAAARAG